MQNLNLQANKEALKHVFSYYEKRDLTIDCILEGTMCSVTVDNEQSPSVFLIQNGSLCILGGDTDTTSADHLLDTIPNGAIILPSPTSWIQKLENSSEFSLQKIDRFSLNHRNISIANLDVMTLCKPSGLTVKRIDPTMAKAISEDQDFKEHFQNYESSADFLRRGLGYVAIMEDAIVGVASSALVCSTGYEINIKVLPEFRGRGFSKVLGAHLIREVLKRDKIPHWDATNKISLNLATQLGYDFTAKYNAYEVQKIRNKIAS